MFVGVFGCVHDLSGTYALTQTPLKITVGCTVKALSRSPSVGSAHSQTFTFIALTEQFHGNSIPSVNPTLSNSTETQSHLSTKKQASRQQSTRATNAEHPVSEDHTTHVRLVCHGTFENLLLPPRSPELERGLTRAQQRLDASTHSVPHRRENNWCSGFRWMLAVRAAQIQEAFCAFELGSYRRDRHDWIRDSCARALGILCASVQNPVLHQTKLASVQQHDTNSNDGIDNKR